MVEGRERPSDGTTWPLSWMYLETVSIEKRHVVPEGSYPGVWIEQWQGKDQRHRGLYRQRKGE